MDEGEENMLQEGGGKRGAYTVYELVSSVEDIGDASERGLKRTWRIEFLEIILWESYASNREKLAFILDTS